MRIYFFTFVLASLGVVNGGVQKAAVGQQVQFYCNTANPKNVVWWFNGHKRSLIYDGQGNIGSEYKSRVRVDTTSSHRIVINDIQMTDSGLYSCVDSESHTSNITLSVSAYLSAFADNDVTLNCYSSSSSRALPVSWTYKSDESRSSVTKYIYEHSKIFDEFRDRMKVPAGTASLTISNTQLQDSGVYTCRENGQDHSFKVIVAIRGGVGTTGRLPSCAPLDSSQVDWAFYKTFGDLSSYDMIYSDGQIYKDQSRYHSTGRGLTIEKLQFNDAGVYVCIEDRGLKDKHYMELFVSECASLSQPVVRNSVCTASCRPNTSDVYEWRYESTDSRQQVVIYKSGTVLPQYKDKVSMQRSPDGSFNLNIDIDSAESSGLYKCVEETGITHCFNISITLQTASNPTTDDTSSDSNNKLLVVIIVVVLIVIGLLVVLVLGVIVVRRRSSKRQDGNQQNVNQNLLGPREQQQAARVDMDPENQRPPPAYVPSIEGPRPIHDKIVELSELLQLYIDPSPLLSSLMERNLLSVEQVQQAYSEDSNFVRVRRIIRYFSQKSEEDHKQLLDLLQLSGQQHVVNFINSGGITRSGEYGDSRPLDRTTVNGIYKHIIAENNLFFNIQSLVDELWKNGSILERHRKYVLQGDMDLKKTGRLVDVICRRDIASYRIFLDCLRKTNNPIADLLMNSIPAQGNDANDAGTGDKADEISWKEFIEKFEKKLYDMI